MSSSSPIAFVSTSSSEVATRRGNAASKFAPPMPVSYVDSERYHADRGHEPEREWGPRTQSFPVMSNSMQNVPGLSNVFTTKHAPSKLPPRDAVHWLSTLFGGQLLENADLAGLDVAEAIDSIRIVKQRDRYAARFLFAQPFRHVVVDGFLQAERARELEAKFPRTENFARRLTQKRCLQRDYGTLPDCFQRLYAELRAPWFVAWLESVTGVFDLEPDRRERIEIGLIESGNGGYHDLHADPNMHPEQDTFRRITVLVYLNEIWRSEWGGSLELWSGDAKRLVTSVEPSFNRCLIMENHDRAYHGHRNGHMPPGVTRKAMALVYFAKTPGEGQSRTRRDTRFRLRPNESFQRRAQHALLSVRRAAKAARNAFMLACRSRGSLAPPR